MWKTCLHRTEHSLTTAREVGFTTMSYCNLTLDAEFLFIEWKTKWSINTIPERKNKVAGDAIMSYVPACDSVVWLRFRRAHSAREVRGESWAIPGLGFLPPRKPKDQEREEPFLTFLQSRRTLLNITEAHRPPFPNSTGRSLSLRPTTSQN